MLIRVGDKKNISLKVIDANNYPVFDDTVVATIQNKSNEKFFNGLFWVEDECELMIPHKEGGLYSIDFIPEEVSLYEINIKSKSYGISSKITLQSTDSISGNRGVDEDMMVNPIIKLTNKTLKNQDGTDTTILDANKNPLVGVKITCYDSKTKDVVAVTQSDNSGAWEMILKHGTYFFTFEKDGFITVAFERTVDICP